MWKIIVEYTDKSKLTLTGKHGDIPLRLAEHYHKQYVSGHRCKAMYQQYPKKLHVCKSLLDKIEELESLEIGRKDNEM